MQHFRLTRPIAPTRVDWIINPSKLLVCGARSHVTPEGRVIFAPDVHRTAFHQTRVSLKHAREEVGKQKLEDRMLSRNEDRQKPYRLPFRDQLIFAAQKTWTAPAVGGQDQPIVDQHRVFRERFAPTAELGRFLFP